MEAADTSENVVVSGLSGIERPRVGALVPLMRASYAPLALAAIERGAVLLVSESLAASMSSAFVSAWVHPNPMAVIATLLASATVEDLSGPVGEDSLIAPSAVILPGVRIGARVRVGPGVVLGAPGFGFATRANGQGLDHVPQLGGVVIEDDVWIGANTTVDAGTLGPTRIRRGAKLDAQVHVGHNCDVGEECGTWSSEDAQSALVCFIPADVGDRCADAPSMSGAWGTLVPCASGLLCSEQTGLCEQP